MPFIMRIHNGIFQSKRIVGNEIISSQSFLVEKLSCSVLKIIDRKSHYVRKEIS